MESNQLWIGLAEVRPLRGCDLLEDAKGAFVNIVTWARNTAEFTRKAKLVLGELRLFLVAVENSEPVDSRREREGGFAESIEDIISRAKDNPNAIIYSTFHLFEKDDA